MTQAQDKEDEQWLSALAGQPDPAADSQVNLQAAAVRRALKARTDLLDATVPVADAALYEQLLFRLRREGLINKPPRPSENNAEAEWDIEVPAFSRKQSDGSAQVSSRRQWRNPMLWGMVATVILGVGVVIQMGGLHLDHDDADRLRGGSRSTVLIVAEPELRLAELLAGLRASGEEPTIQRETDRRIVLTVRGSQKVLDYLAGQRIDPIVTDGMITLTLVASKKQK